MGDTYGNGPDLDPEDPGPTEEPAPRAEVDIGDPEATWILPRESEGGDDAGG